MGLRHGVQSSVNKLFRRPIKTSTAKTYHEIKTSVSKDKSIKKIMVANRGEFKQSKCSNTKSGVQRSLDSESDGCSDAPLYRFISSDTISNQFKPFVSLFLCLRLAF